MHAAGTCRILFSLRPLRLFFALFAVKSFKALNRKERQESRRTPNCAVLRTTALSMKLFRFLAVLRVCSQLFMLGGFFLLGQELAMVFR